jgi:hypothetical protein
VGFGLWMRAGEEQLVVEQQTSRGISSGFVRTGRYPTAIPPPNPLDD